MVKTAILITGAVLLVSAVCGICYRNKIRADENKEYKKQYERQLKEIQTKNIEASAILFELKKIEGELGKNQKDNGRADRRQRRRLLKEP